MCVLLSFCSGTVLCVGKEKYRSLNLVIISTVLLDVIGPDKIVQGCACVVGP